MKDKAKEGAAERQKFAFGMLTCAMNPSQGIRTDLLAMCDSGRIIMCREADRSTDLFPFETLAPRSGGDYSC